MTHEEFNEKNRQMDYHKREIDEATDILLKVAKYERLAKRHKDVLGFIMFVLCKICNKIWVKILNYHMKEWFILANETLDYACEALRNA